MTVAITGLKEAIADMQAKAVRCRDLTPVLKVGAQIVGLAIDDAFRKGQAPDGSPWAPNKPSTIRSKGSSKVGVDTGRLRSSMSARVEGSNTIAWGTNVPYAGPFTEGSHRTGTRKTVGYNPKRPKGSAWVSSTPARPVFPTFPGTGPGAAIFAKVTALVGRYIVTGKLT